MEKQLLQLRDFNMKFHIDNQKEPKMVSKIRGRLTQKLLQKQVNDLDEAKNILDVSNSLVDIAYMTIGLSHEYGIADRFIMLFDEVHNSNMTKLNEDGSPRLRKDGKISKTKFYKRPKLRPILERNLNLYKNSSVLKEIARIEKRNQEKVIENKIKKHLNFFDKLLYIVYSKIEKRLKKKVEVSFPIRQDGKISVLVYGKMYEV
tara:strand:- start:2901 stop:3512 length:612 start_codon:yes stop_codon:yes gene_type:complete